MKFRLRLPKNPALRRALRALRNKYLLTTLVFAVWIGFFDSNSLIDRLSLNRQIASLERDVAYYTAVVKENSERLDELKTDSEKLEKYAREHYLMKRANEDIFIVVE